MGRVLGAGFLHLHGAWYPQLPDVRERLSADGQAERGAGGPVLPRYGADGGVQRTGGQFACIYSIPYLIHRPLRVVQRTIFEKKCFVFVPIFLRIPSVQLPFFLWSSLLLLPFNDGPHLAFAQHLSYCLLPDKAVFSQCSLDNSWVCVSFFSSFNSSCFFLTAFWHPERCWAPAILLRLRRHADGWWRYAQGMHSHVHGSRPHQSLQSTVWGRNLIRRFFSIQCYSMGCQKIHWWLKGLGVGWILCG